jgi:pyruvate dehydrogenase E2 component (dihydrolipoamide acetyltransferase)
VADGSLETEEGTHGEPASAGPRGDVETVELSRSRQTAARRVAESRATIPHLYVGAEARLGGGARLDALLVHACAAALREHPDLNGAYRDGRLERYSRVNVGFAVAAEGVVWPTIFDADTKGVAAIADELDELTARAEQGAITKAELAGATFSVSALGSSSTRFVWPTITPGHAAALAVGSAGRETLGVVLGCDERLADARLAGSFLDRVVAILETAAT